MRTKRIFNISYTLSKRPHLHRAYVIGVCIFFAMAVNLILRSYKNKIGFLTKSLLSFKLRSPLDQLWRWLSKRSVNIQQEVGRRLWQCCRDHKTYLNWNNSSMLLESSCSDVENRKAEVSFSARDLSFSEIGQLFSQA